MTVEEIRNALYDEFEGKFGQKVQFLPRNFLRVLSGILAVVFVLLYKYIGFILLQMFVRTASFKPISILGKSLVPLTEWSRLVGSGDPKDGTQAEYLIDITVTQSGGQLSQDTQFQSAVGVTYLLVAPVDISNPAITVFQGHVRAAQDPNGTDGVGEIGRLNPFVDTLQFVEPLGNVEREVAVTAEQIPGLDGEEETPFRTRVEERFARRPEGGAYMDYRIWGEQDLDIHRVYPYTADLPGQADVYVEATTDIDPDGIPTQTQLDRVAENIQLTVGGIAFNRPLGTFVNTYPIVRNGWTVTVVGLIAPLEEAQTQADITEALTEHFFGLQQFIVELGLLPQNDIVRRSSVMSIVDRIVTAAGGTFTDVLVEKTLTPGPIFTYVLVQGEAARLDTVAY